MGEIMRAILLILVSMVCLAATGSAQGADSLTLRYGQERTASDGLRVRFVAVEEDSRCPENVNCVWAGNARIRITVTSGRDQQALVLNTTGERTARFGDHEFELT